MTEDKDIAAGNLEAMSRAELVAFAEQLDTKLKKYRSMQEFTWKQVNSILSSIPLGLAILNEEGYIEATNLQLRQMLERDSADLFGKNVRDIFLDLDRLEGSPEPRRGKAIASGGKPIAVELSINEVFKDGRKFFLHVKDISQAEKLLEYKMSLASMVSHDMRTPLTTMRSVLTSIQDGLYGKLDEDGSQAVTWALLSSDHMTALLANILDMEKIDSVGLVLDRTETTSGRIVNEALSLCRLYAEEADVELTAEVENNVFYGDEAKLIRILVNLITNAVKFSSAGATVQVKAGLSGVDVAFEVTDSGPGIEDEIKELIFNRFQQAGSLKRGSKAGFGLGLAISKQFAEMHNGSITVQSDGVSGSTFILKVPLGEAPALI